VVKLMGAGEYAAERVAGEGTGHFGLAVRDYAHSTAPNRRYPDLITQRLIKAALDGKRSPYSARDLESLAEHCTNCEESIKKVERQVEKSAAAALLQDRTGERFDAIVSGATEWGVWVRLFEPPVEGKLIDGSGLTQGDALLVELVRADVARGFVDFKRALRRGAHLKSRSSSTSKVPRPDAETRESTAPGARAKRAAGAAKSGGSHAKRRAAGPGRRRRRSG
jgi:exoribonuclease-2